MVGAKICSGPIAGKKVAKSRAVLVRVGTQGGAPVGAAGALCQHGQQAVLGWRDAINMRRKKQPACPTQSYKKCQHSGIKVLIPIFSNFNPQPLYQVKGKCYFSKQPTSQFAGGCVAFVCFWAQTDAEKIFFQGYS